MKSKALIIPLVIVLFVLYQGIYTVDETRQVVITQFGKPVDRLSEHRSMADEIEKLLRPIPATGRPISAMANRC